MMRTYVHAYGWPRFVLILLSQCLGWLEQTYLLPPHTRASPPSSPARSAELGRPSEHDESYPRSSAIPVWKGKTEQGSTKQAVWCGARSKVDGDDQVTRTSPAREYVLVSIPTNRRQQLGSSSRLPSPIPSRTLLSFLLSFFLTFFSSRRRRLGGQAGRSRRVSPSPLVPPRTPDGRTDAAGRHRGWRRRPVAAPTHNVRFGRVLGSTHRLRFGSGFSSVAGSPPTTQQQAQ